MAAKHKQKVGGRPVSGSQSQLHKPNTDASLGGKSPIRKKAGDLVISVRAKPGAKQSAVTDVSAEAVSIQISAPAQEGETNAELMQFLANLLGVRKSSVLLERGHKSREKCVRVQDCELTTEEALKIFKTAIE